MDGVVVITGGTRGIGLAAARRLAARGIPLVLGYRGDAEAAASAETELASLTEVRAVQSDVGTDEGAAALFEAADGVGAMAGLVNSAGVLERQSRFVDIDLARWRRVFETNVLGTVRCCREAVPRMAGAGGGAIVNVSSRAAVLGSPDEYVDYAASKAAVDTLTRGLALEVAGSGIRVNSVRPGIIDTDIHASGGEPGRVGRLAPSLPMRRGGSADEVAAAIEWLLSSEASYVTGTTVDVSGGR
ncbi:SDR family oxidoreductase [Nocardioides antri]|uniref:SDR family oxidoreductase n=1 Tax=Nocardioides antri TaxID=2607659 RepID=A0A5B1M387_9ACTN|nr:SDR family oxidoreductase [Nocardioides antri]